MNVLLLGSSGYIGSAFDTELQRRGISCYRPKRDTRDYTRFEVLKDILEFTHFDLVINCAAFITRPSVDLCEDHKAECIKGNLIFPIKVMLACERVNAPLMHISTGCLFNGDNGGGGWSEEDEPQLTFDTGAGYYVGCKQLAEQTLGGYRKVYNCRIRLPFDHLDDQRNYISKLTRFLKVFEAQNSLSHRGDFVNACLDLLECGAPFGTYNMTNPGSIRTHEIVGLIKKHLLPKANFNYWDEGEFLTKVARTPKSNCVLNTSKLLATGVKMRSTAEAVEHAIQNWQWNKNLCQKNDS